MSAQRAAEGEVLVSDGRCASKIHLPLGEMTRARCGVHQSDLERTTLDAVPGDYERCQNCPFPGGGA